VRVQLLDGYKEVCLLSNSTFGGHGLPTYLRGVRFQRNALRCLPPNATRRRDADDAAAGCAADAPVPTDSRSKNSSSAAADSVDKTRNACSDGDESTATAASVESKTSAVASTVVAVSLPRRTRSLSSPDVASAVAAGLPRRTRSSSGGSPTASSPSFWPGLTDFAADFEERRDECADDGGRSRGSDDGPRQRSQTSETPKGSSHRSAGSRRGRPPLPPKPGKKSRKQSKRDSARTESATKHAGETEEPVDFGWSGRPVDPRLPEFVEPAFGAGSKPTARRVDPSCHLSCDEPKGRKDESTSKAAVGADWEPWTDIASYPASMEPDAIAPRRIDQSRHLFDEESKGREEDFSSNAAVGADWDPLTDIESHPFSMEPDARRIDQSRHLSRADWDLWTEASSHPLSILQDDSRTVGEESACSILTEYLADGEEGPDESDRRDLPSDGPSLGRQTREATKVSVASEIGPGQYLVRVKSSLIVKTQLESLALRMSFRSQLRLGICQKSVRFDKLSIREYPIVIGDSPSTSRGVPLSIGWEYEPESTVDVDTYETTRDIGGVCERRSKSELR
ncbi:hypothetical protein THAOC_07109, partial [Thalassiosira oceanica]